MKKQRYVLLIVSLSVLLTACGGGGGNDDSTPSNNTNQVTKKSFSVALTRVDIKRVSNKEPLNIDTSDISSGTLLLAE